jgi:hypothetical protein
MINIKLKLYIYKCNNMLMINIKYINKVIFNNIYDI